jgi:hypothetical protein
VVTSSAQVQLTQPRRLGSLRNAHRRARALAPEAVAYRSHQQAMMARLGNGREEILAEQETLASTEDDKL